MRKLEMKFDKPTYVGMRILDISKTCLYEFHHEYMLPLYHKKYKIMYTDTDSLIYHIEYMISWNAILLSSIRTIIQSTMRTVFHSVNKKVSGLMKDENNAR